MGSQSLFAGFSCSLNSLGKGESLVRIKKLDAVWSSISSVIAVCVALHFQVHQNGGRKRSGPGTTIAYLGSFGWTATALCVQSTWAVDYLASLIRTTLPVAAPEVFWKLQAVSRNSWILGGFVSNIGCPRGV